MRRTLADIIGNYIFFVPLVILFTPALQNPEGMVQYMIAAVPITLIGARVYTAFLKKIWYPLWKVEF